MTEEEFEDKMNTYELEDRYAEFIEANHPVGNNHVLIRLMESGDFYEAFKESMVTQFEPRREWVGLTDDEIEALAKKHNGIFYDCDIEFAHAIENKLKEKNS